METLKAHLDAQNSRLKQKEEELNEIRLRCRCLELIVEKCNCEKTNLLTNVEHLENLVKEKDDELNVAEKLSEELKKRCKSLESYNDKLKAELLSVNVDNRLKDVKTRVLEKEAADVTKNQIVRIFFKKPFNTISNVTKGIHF